LLGLIPRPPGRIEAGSARFEGIDLLNGAAPVLRAIRGRRIGMIFQDPMTSLNPYLTVEEQLVEPLLIHGLADRAEARRLALAALKEVGVPDAERRIRNHPHQFSGGMRQRVMIAMALIAKPDLLIADEPTTALDVTVQAQILDLIEREQDAARSRGDPDLARPRRGRRGMRPGDGDVCGKRGRNRARGHPVPRAAASVHARAPAVAPRAAGHGCGVVCDPRLAARSGAAARGVPVHAALRVRDRRVRDRENRVVATQWRILGVPAGPAPRDPGWADDARAGAPISNSRR
jgi:predicted ABC-type transport system involved in lysophospholipase L1 biosynthesis ATPase subunit